MADPGSIPENTYGPSSTAKKDPGVQSTGCGPQTTKKVEVEDATLWSSVLCICEVLGSLTT